MLAHTKRGRGLEAKKMETERAGSVLAVLHPTLKEGDVEEVVEGSCFVHTREVREVALG